MPRGPSALPPSCRWKLRRRTSRWRPTERELRAFTHLLVGGAHTLEPAGYYLNDLRVIRVSQSRLTRTPAARRVCGGWSHGHDWRRARIRVHPASPTSAGATGEGTFRIGSSRHSV